MPTYFKAVREDGTSFHESESEFVWVDPARPVEAREVTHAVTSPCSRPGVELRTLFHPWAT
ncbi:hypothetical protein EQW78_17785 [Oerskovia turbata]|uniref:Uncharacterized protein n=1 Tax=Oerskovia turbata TaxID=1713 RepID=A0A4Q1KJR1_9CELL|nr:hypothetical protein [Oerskovia turbata]RXR21561.1 hypothetical protein EQW73_17755 [Oerskovia turbata]RXR29439.1 hypothetical protein EQW78_17785 [Oerskovia turbata]